jgi:tetratricopeptide (TPR) repeat protein
MIRDIPMIGFRWTVVIALAILMAGCSGSSGTGADNSAAQAQQSRQPLQPQDIADANVALAEGTRLFDNGDTDKAIELFNRAVELNADLAEAYFKLGIAYALVEARDAEIVETQVEPTPTPEKGKESKKKTKSGEAFEKAVTAYKKHLDANPEDDVAYFNLGRAYNKLNEDEDAAKALKQAVKLKPDDTEYQTELGAILVKLAQYHEAIAPLKKAVDLDPENTRAIGLLEDAEAGRKRVDYATEKKDSKGSNSNISSNSNTAAGANSNTEVKPKPNETKEVKPPPPPTNRPN